MKQYKGGFMVKGIPSLLHAFATELQNVGYTVEIRADGNPLTKLYVHGYDLEEGKNIAIMGSNKFEVNGVVSVIDVPSHWNAAMNQLKIEILTPSVGLWVTTNKTETIQQLKRSCVRIEKVIDNYHFETDEFGSDVRHEVLDIRDFRPASISEIKDSILKNLGFKTREGVEFTSVDYLLPGELEISPSWSETETLAGVVGTVFHYDLTNDILVTGGYGAHVLYKKGEYATRRTGIPKINNHTGKYENGVITYGCAQFTVDYLKAIASVNERFNAVVDNRPVVSVTLNSGVTVNIEQIHEILRYVQKNATRPTEERAN